jgi:hypothetical protein
LILRTGAIHYDCQEALGETGSGGDQNWDGTFSTNETSPVGWTIGDQALDSSNGGVTWMDVNAGPHNESPKFAVDASPVPEPSSIVILLGFGGVSLIGMVRHRRRPM